jgi:plastocyanin
MSMSARSSKILMALLMALAMVGVACGGDTAGTDEPAAGSSEPAEEDSPTEDAAATLDFNATEYAFSVAPTAPAGTTTVNLINVGEEPHMLDLVPLAEDAPPVDKLIKMSQKKASQFFAGQLTHLKTVKAGEEISKEVDLQPGRYAYVCFYAEKGEPPHAFKGMVGELTVE